MRRRRRGESRGKRGREEGRRRKRGREEKWEEGRDGGGVPVSY